MIKTKSKLINSKNGYLLGKYSNNIILLIMILLFASTSAALENTTVHLDVQIALDSLEEQKQILEDDGFYVSRVTDYILEAQRQINNSNLVLANNTINKAKEAISLARESGSGINSIENKIISAKNTGLLTTDAQIYLDDAKEEFLIENYEGAKIALENANSALSIQTAEEYGYILIQIDSISALESRIGASNGMATIFRSQFINLRNNADILGIWEFEKNINNYNATLIDVLDINKTISLLAQDGQKTEIFSELLVSSIESISSKDEKTLSELVKNYKDRKTEYYNTKYNLELIVDKIKLLDIRGVDTDKFQKNIEKINENMKQGDYKSSSLLAIQTYQELESLESQRLFDLTLREKINIKEWILENFVLVFLLVIMLIILFLFSFKSIKYFTVKTREKILKKNISVLESLLADTQTQYFKQKTISKDSYTVLMDKYQEKLVNTREKLFLLEKSTEKSNILKGKDQFKDNGS